MEKNKMIDDEMLEQAVGGSGMTAAAFNVGDIVRKHESKQNLYFWGTITGRSAHAYDSNFTFGIDIVRQCLLIGVRGEVEDCSTHFTVESTEIGNEYVKVSSIPECGPHWKNEPYFL